MNKYFKPTAPSSSPVTPVANKYFTPNAPVTPQAQPKSLFSQFADFTGSMARAAIKPIAQTAIQMPRALMAGVSGLAGDTEAEAAWSKPVNVPFLGEVKGLSANPEDAQKYGTQTARETAGQALEMGASLVPTGKGIIGGLKTGAAVGALSGAGTEIAKEGSSAGDVVKSSLIGGTIGGVMGAAVPAAESVGKWAVGTAKSIVHPEAEQSLIKAIKPGKNNVTFKSDLQTTLGELEPHADKIKDLPSLDAAIKAKKLEVWESVKSKLQNEGKDAAVDFSPAADAIDKIAQKPIFKLKDPQAAEQLTTLSERLRGQKLSFAEAEDALESLNAGLDAYYKKNMSSRSLAQRADPAVAADIEIADAIRKQFDDKLEGFGTLKKTYGALANVGREVSGRIPVAERQNMMSLAEQISAARTAGNVAGSALTGNFGQAIGHTLDFIVANKMKAADTSDAKVASAFQALLNAKKPQSMLSKATDVAGKASSKLAPAGKVIQRGATMEAASFPARQ